jgi:MYXO-CTERM domain-containing protein
VTSRPLLAVLAGLLIALGAGSARPVAAVAAAAAAAQTQTTPGTNEARIGGRAFGSRRPTFRTRRPSVRRPSVRRPIRRRPLFGWHGVFGGFLRFLGIAYLMNLLFGWGPGGSPFGLLLVLLVVVWLATRRRRRPTYYW